jgi:hypothetical protein
MKKALIFAALVALVLVGVPAFAGLDAYDSVTVTTVSLPKTATGVQTNAAVDMYAAKGKGSLILTFSAADTNAADFGASAALYTSAASAGTYTAVTGASAASAGVAGTGTVSTVAVDASALKRYVKLFTVATNDTCRIGAVIVFPK